MPTLSETKGFFYSGLIPFYWLSNCSWWSLRRARYRR